MIATTAQQAATIRATLIECVLFGVYTCVTLFTIWKAKRAFRKPRPALAITISLYILTCARFVCDLVQFQKVLGDTSNPLIPDEADYLTALFSVVFSFLSIFATDCLICWRCWIIWDHNKYILIALTPLQIVSFIGAFTLITMNAIFTRHPPTARETKIYTILVLALVGITVVLNLATTLLIVIKLWLGGRRIGSGFYKPVMMMIVESGALYTVGMISYLIVALVGKPVAAVYTTRITNMLMGTAPTLIILRLSCGFFQQGDNHSSVATNTNVEFAQPRISPEESVADAVDVSGPPRRSRTVSLDDGRPCQTLTSGARVELQNSDMEKHAQESLERQ